MNAGYIKIHRKIAASQVFQNPDLLKVWLWCLLKASYKERYVSVDTGRGQTEILLKPGQFIYGRRAAAKELRMKPSSVRNRIEKLKNMRNLDIQPDTHFSIITVLNWDGYQIDEIKKDRQQDNQRTGKGQPKDTNKKVNKVKAQSFPENSHQIELSKLLFQKIREREPNFKKPDFQKWGIHIERMIRLDERTPEEIKTVIIWCQKDDFWQSNILSTQKLRKQFSQLLLKMPEEKPVQKINRGNFD